MADDSTIATTTSEAPAATPAAETVSEPKRSASAAHRAEAALAKYEQAKGDAATTEPAAVAKSETVEAKPADKPSDKPEAKPPQSPSLARSLAIIAAREEKVRAAEATLRTRQAEIETKLAADSADLQTVRDVKAALAKGGRAAALKALGIDLRTAIAELSRTYEEPTAEDIARRVAAEEFESRQKAAEERAKSERAETEQRAAAAQEVEAVEFCQRASAICGGIETTAYPRVVTYRVTGPQFWGVAQSMREQLGRKPQPTEVLAEIEKTLKEREDSIRTREQPKAQPTARATSVPRTEASQEPPAKPTGRRPTRTATPAERASAAMKRLGIS